MNRFYWLSALLLSVVLSQANAQSTYVRIAKLLVDSTHLADYTAALQEEIESAVQVEPGVLSMYAVADKNQPYRFTILETYASRAAYEQHLQTPHFQKYKTGTLGWVRSLELTDAVPVIAKSKQLGQESTYRSSFLNLSR